jgi:hypothetical protein
MCEHPAVKLLRAALLLLTAASLAGCGGGGGGNGVADKNADQIVADAVAAAKAAQTVHVPGKASGESLEIDMHLVAGKGGDGHLVVNGLSFDIVRIGDRAYFRGDETFWQQFGGGDVIELLEGRWVEAPADTGDLASLTPLTDLEQFFGGVLEDHGTLAKGDETEIGGVAAIAIEDTTEGGTLYVATEGEPYPLKIDGPDDSPGSIVFDEWNGDHALEAPTDTVDLEKLQSG